MKNLFKTLICSFLITSSVYAAEKYIDLNSGTFGNGLSFRANTSYINFLSDSKLKPDGLTQAAYRSVSMNKEGMFQIFTSHGNTDKQTYMRVYYLFPLLTQHSVKVNEDRTIQVTHASGAKFDVNKNGRFNSPQLEMKMSVEISANNRGGVEIESYPNGIVVDMGTRIAETPNADPFRKITVKDKNKKQCQIVNSEFMSITGPSNDREASLKYKTNEELHKFFTAKCPGLDFSDLLKKPLEDKLNTLNKAKEGVSAPVVEKKPEEDSSQRTLKEKEEMDQQAVDEFLDAVAKEDKELADKKKYEEKKKKEKQELEKNKAGTK